MRKTEFESVSEIFLNNACDLKFVEYISLLRYSFSEQSMKTISRSIEASVKIAELIRNKNANLEQSKLMIPWRSPNLPVQRSRSKNKN